MTKVELRNAWFQVHKWIGLILAVLIIPISLTGALLVWHEPTEKVLHPERYAVTGPASMGLGAYAASAQSVLGAGERLQQVQLPEEAGDPVTVTASKPGKGRPQRLTVYLDPGTAKVLGTARSGEGVLQVMHRLHGSMMVPGIGRQIVGWVGVAMLISSISGLWLWWPLVGSVRRGLRWKRHSNLDTNLHHQMGFWISLPLFVLSLTGVWISFPQWFAGFEARATQDGAPGGQVASRRFAAPLVMPQEALTPVIAKAEEIGGGRAASLRWPTEQAGEWTVAVEPESGEPVSVKLAVGDLSAMMESAGEQPETVARLMRRIHDGNGLPFIWQLIIFLGGMVPVALAVTGIIMWWRARRWRQDITARRVGRTAE